LSKNSIVILGAPPMEMEVTTELVKNQIAKLKANKMLLILKKQ
jgi:hypothetical protein